MYFKNKVHSIRTVKRNVGNSSSSSSKWNSFFTVHDFYDVVMPFFYIAKVFGHFSFTLVGTNEREKIKNYRTCIWDVVLFLLNIALNVSFLFNQMKLESIQPGEIKSLIMAVGVQLVLIYSTSIAIVSSVVVFLLRSKIAAAIGQIHRIDQEILKLGSQINHQQQHLVVLFYCVFYMVTGLAMVLVTNLMINNYKHDLDLRSSAFVVAVYYYSNSSYSVVMNSYYLSLLAVKTRLGTLNDSIRKIFVTSSYQSTLPINDNTEDVDGRDLIKRMALIYDRLVDTVETLNYCFSVQVMAATASCFGFNVMCIFSLYHLFTMEHVSQYQIVFNMLVNVMWNIYYLSFFFLIIFVGSALSKEGRMTGILIHRSINVLDIENACIIDQLRLFSQQLQHKTPVASCGLYSFDWSLLYSTIASSATYLIILIQFDTTVTNGSGFNQTFNSL